jgi:hypothetical protein
MSKVNKALRQFLRDNLPVQSIIATVKELDETNFTCSVQPVDDGAMIHGVRLKPVIDDNDNGIIAIPAIGSDVIVALAYNDHSSVYISVTGKVKKYLIKTETNGVIELQGNSLGGLVKAAALTDKLNNVENDINALKQAFSSWVVVPNDGGAALKASAGTWAGQDITPTQSNEIENTKVKHG